MKEFQKVFASSGNLSAVLINRVSDPVMWIVYVYKKILFFKKKISSHWFYNQNEAEKFAESIVKNA